MRLQSRQHRTWLWAPGRSSPSGDGRRAVEEMETANMKDSEKVQLFFLRRCESGTHLSTVDIVQNKVQLVCSLEGVVQPHQEGVLDVLHQHAALSHDVLLLK